MGSTCSRRKPLPRRVSLMLEAQFYKVWRCYGGCEDCVRNYPDLEQAEAFVAQMRREDHYPFSFRVEAPAAPDQDETRPRRWQRTCPACIEAQETGSRLCDDHEDGEPA